MIIKEKKRKTRSDKKRDVKPTLPILLKECIERLAYVTDTPIKDVSETICISGLASKEVIEYLSQNFKRNYNFNNTIYFGDLSIESLQNEKIKGVKERISIRFKSDTYEQINALAYALDVTPTRATTILLDASIRNMDYIKAFVNNYLEDALSPGQKRELKEILKYINKNNPYEEEISLNNAVSYLITEIKSGASSFGGTLQGWIRKKGKK
ncbi:hypothetical protein ACV242_005502 [Peribacillus simplex]